VVKSCSWVLYNRFIRDSSYQKEEGGNTKMAENTVHGQPEEAEGVGPRAVPRRLIACGSVTAEEARLHSALGATCC
jgi:hypothetical protein